MEFITETEWVKEHGMVILAIVIGAWIVKRFGIIVFSRIIKRSLARHGHLANGRHVDIKRQETIVSIFKGLISALVWPIALIMILSELNIDIAPLVAGAGIIGVALGFGAQYLVRDVISGLFIVLENQYRVGDIVNLDGTSGKVEEITLRITRLRNLDGVVHYVPNGSISRSSNLSQELSSINEDIGVSYDSDLDKVIKVVNKVGADLAKDKDWKDRIIVGPSFLRVDAFADSAIIIKITGDVKPGKQWAVKGEFFKRLKEAFDKEGIEIPFPQMVVHKAK